MRIGANTGVSTKERGIHTADIVMIVLLFITSSVLTIFISDNVRSEEVSGDIIFDEDSDFIGSPHIDSGSGTSEDPYVVSDLSMGDHAIIMLNVSKSCIYKNISFSGATNRYPFYFYGIENVKLINIDICSDRNFISSYDGNSINLFNCTIKSKLNSGQLIYINKMKNISLCSSHISFLNQPQFKQISLAPLEKINMTRNYFSRMIFFTSIHAAATPQIQIDIQNNTFENSRLEIGDYRLKLDTVGRIRCNVFLNTTEFNQPALELKSSLFNEISNNYFYHNHYGISIVRGIVSSNFHNNEIFNNIFNGCIHGIWLTHSTTSPLDSSATIFFNKFVNGTKEAILIDDGDVKNLIYSNYFINNNNNKNQVKDQNTQYPLNRWNNSVFGNYWSDHTSPDFDGDGAVDKPYDVGTTNDSYPCTNINLDRKRPNIWFSCLDPVSLNRSYIWASWGAEDEYGIERVDLSFDNTTWTNVTDIKTKSFYITPEHNHIYIKATDGNGLFKVNPAEFDIDKEYSPIEIIHPVHGTYIPDDPLIISWSIEDYINVTEQKFSIDGVRTNISDSARTFKLGIEEGPHRATVTIMDEDNLTLTRTVDFFVDRNAPMIIVSSPRPNSFLSNKMVNVYHSITDEVNLISAYIRFDSSDWTGILGQVSTSRLLLEGEHLIEIKAEDSAGHMSEMKIPITIGEDTKIKFISPTPGEYTNKGTCIVEWEYSGPIEWVNAQLRVGKESELFDIGTKKSIEIILPREGTFDITLRLNDAFNNYCERTISLIRDIKPPLLFLKDIGEFVNTGNYLLEWNPQDDHGINRSMVKLDDGDWVDAGSNTSTILELDDGEHSVQVRVLDKAGNSAEVSAEFIVDTVLPIVTIKEPVNDIYSNDPTMTVSWTVYDEHDINVTTLTLNDGNPIDVTGSTSYSITTSTEGTSTVVISSQDMAGNLGREQVSFIIDLTSPSIEWKNLPNENFKEPKLTLEWTVNDNIALDSLSLSYNDETLTIDIDRTKIELELEEGLYTFTLKATDKAGNSRSTKLDTDINIDRTSPALDLVETGCSVEGNMMTIEWTCDDGSGIDRIEVSVDGGEFSELEIGKTSTTLGPFEPGPHNVRIRAFDLAGNMEERTWNFNIEKEAEASEDGGGTLIAVIIIVIVLIVLVVIGAVIFLMTRKKKGEDTTEIEVKTDQEDLPPNGQTPQKALSPANAKEKDALIAPKLRPSTIPVLPSVIPAPVQQPPINAQTPQSANSSKIETPSGDATYIPPRK